jgi:hypothetical protein
MASAASGQPRDKVAARATKVQAVQCRTAKPEVGSKSAQPDDDDDSSWGDGSSTEEVCPSFTCSLILSAPNRPTNCLFQDVTATDGPVPDDGDEEWEDVDESVVPSQPNRFRSKKK